MEVQLTNELNNFNTLDEKIQYLDSLKTIINTQYSVLFCQRLTEKTKNKVRDELQNGKSILFEQGSACIFNKPTQESINEMVQLLDRLEITEYNYNDIGELDVSATISMTFRFGNLIFNFGSTECDNHGQEMFEIDCSAHHSVTQDYFSQKEYSWSCVSDWLTNDIQSLGMTNVTIDDFVLLLTKITEMEYHLYYSERE